MKRKIERSKEIDTAPHHCVYLLPLSDKASPLVVLHHCEDPVNPLP